MPRKSKSKRRYTDEFRASALAALAANGGNVERTAVQIGVPVQTLRNWARGARHPEATEMGVQKRGAMADALQEIAWKLIEVLPAKIETAPLNHAATTLGITIDKMRILRGEPTTIAEQSVALDLNRLTDEQLLALAAILRDASPAPGGAGPAGPPEAR